MIGFPGKVILRDDENVQKIEFDLTNVAVCNVNASHALKHNELHSVDDAY